MPRNEAEWNVFFDYISLYRRLNRKRAIADWRIQHAELVTPQNTGIISAFEKARFTLLRLNENLAHGAITVTDVIREKNYLLMDRGLNASKLSGRFFVCSLIERDHYCMTSGCGIPLNPYADAGKSALTLFKKHLPQLQGAKTLLNREIAACVQTIYGFCLRGGALIGMGTT